LPAATPAYPVEVPALLTVVVGTEELLTARAVRRVVADFADAGPPPEVVELPAAEADPAGLAELLSPSLLAERRVVVLTGIDSAGKDLARAIEAYAATPDPDLALVLVHRGGPKGKGLLDKLVAGGARRVDCEAPRRAEDRERFVVEEVQAAGGHIDRPAAQALLVAVGGDLRELASACAQLVADSGGRIDEQTVARYHSGRADAGSFAVADRAVEGDVAEALELARWALAVGQSPAGITGALATNLRTIGLVAGAGAARAGSAAGAIASELDLPPWKVRKAAGWARGWHPAALAAAIRAVATADEEVKGAAVDAGYAIERMVLAVTAARGAGRNAAGQPR
jgi:DNA polymerase-3 subunit delta